MNLAQLAKKVSALPSDEAFKFDWPGSEHWHKEVFARQVKTLPEAIAYIDKLRERMGDYAQALAELQDAYFKMRNVLLEMAVKK